MRTLLTSLLLMLCLAAPLRAADPASGPSPSDDGPPLKLGENVVLPRSVYAQILAREDGLATIERIQARASDAERFEGVPHLAILFAGVLLFFWSSMFYYQRKQERLLGTIQLFVEKGLAVPAELLRAVEGAESDDEKGSPATAPPSATPAWASNLMWGGAAVGDHRRLRGLVSLAARQRCLALGHRGHRVWHGQHDHRIRQDQDKVLTARRDANGRGPYRARAAR